MTTSVKSQARIDAEQRAVDGLKPARDEVAKLQPKAQEQAARIVELIGELMAEIDAWQGTLQGGIRIANGVWGNKYGRGHVPYQAGIWLGEITRTLRRVNEVPIPLPLELLDD